MYLKVYSLLIAFSCFSFLGFAQPDIVKNTEPSEETNISSFKYMETTGTKTAVSQVERELMDMFPELVVEKEVKYMYGKNAYRTKKVKTLDEEKLTHRIVSLLKEQKIEIEKLKAEIAELKK